MSDDPDIQAGSLGMSLDELRERYPAPAAWGVRCAELHIALEDLLAYVTSLGGYTTPEQQQAVQQAREALGEPVHSEARQKAIDEWLARHPGPVRGGE